tara:strand:+ start:1997 stop:2449 length:453 start_codon:yes stop_codon:yes gene_type:complete
MMKKRQGVYAVLFSFVVLMLLLQGCKADVKEPSSKYPSEKIEELAQCLTDNGVVMYGAFWCPHCANTKKKFGYAFSYVNYIECDPRCIPDEKGNIIAACQGYEGRPELCIERDIKGYDTWTFPDGTRAVGEPSLELLDEESGCNVLPEVE